MQSPRRGRMPEIGGTTFVGRRAAYPTESQAKTALESSANNAHYGKLEGTERGQLP